jgi:hypothetical protein
MRAVFIKGPSQYDATRLFTDELAGAFAQQGHEAVVVDALGEEDFGTALMREAIAGPTGLVHSIGCMGDMRDGLGRSLGEMFGAPHVLQHVDYPLSHLNQLDHTARLTALLTVDPSHVEALASTFGSDHFAHLAFCPHAAVGAPAEDDEDVDRFADRRSVPILFSGSFYGVQAPGWAEEGAGIRAIFDAAMEIILAVEFLPALEALDQALRDHGQDPFEPRFERMRKYATMLHEQARRIRRQALFDAAGRAGLPIFFIGAGYEGHIERYPTFKRAEPVNLSDAVKLMRHARVVLNINANFGRGSHERPLTAMLAGAAVASDHSSWWAEQFVEGQDMLLYRWTDLDAGLSRLAALAEDPEAAWRMARSAKTKALAGHRFDHRVASIIAAAEAVRIRHPQVFPTAGR